MYVQDELFLPMRQFLGQEVGTLASHVCTTSSSDVLPVAFNAVFTLSTLFTLFVLSFYEQLLEQLLRCQQCCLTVPPTVFFAVLFIVTAHY